MRGEANEYAVEKNAAKLDAAANTGAVATATADPDHYWVLDRIAFSYDGTPTAGRLTVTFVNAIVWRLDVPASGPKVLRFPRGLHLIGATKNQALNVSLAAGGAGVTGKVNFTYR